MVYQSAANSIVPEPAKRRRVLLVDDSPEFLVSATRFLSQLPWIEVVAYASSGIIGINQVALVHPDVVLMDLNMPGMNGLEATRQIKAQRNPPCVILVTLSDSHEYRLAAAEAKADGFITKSDFGSHIAQLLDKHCNR